MDIRYTIVAVLLATIPAPHPAFSQTSSPRSDRIPPGAVGDEEFKSFVRSTEPLTPAAERDTFVLPAGFEIQLVAAEPDIGKPMNMAFDARGRLWVSSSVDYSYPAADGQ